MTYQPKHRLPVTPASPTLTLWLDGTTKTIDVFGKEHIDVRVEVEPYVDSVVTRASVEWRPKK